MIPKIHLNLKSIKKVARSLWTYFTFLIFYKRKTTPKFLVFYKNKFFSTPPFVHQFPPQNAWNIPYLVHKAAIVEVSKQY